MHIPSTKSQLVEIEDFYSALEKSEKQDHIRYNVQQWLYVPNDTVIFSAQKGITLSSVSA